MTPSVRQVIIVLAVCAGLLGILRAFEPSDAEAGPSTWTTGFAGGGGFDGGINGTGAANQFAYFTGPNTITSSAAVARTSSMPLYVEVDQNADTALTVYNLNAAIPGNASALASVSVNDGVYSSTLIEWSSVHPIAQLANAAGITTSRPNGTVFENRDNAAPWTFLSRAGVVYTPKTIIADSGVIRSFTPLLVFTAYVNGVTTATTNYGGYVLDGTNAITLTAITGRRRAAGSGGTTNAIWRVTDGTNVCDFVFACIAAAGNFRIAGTGTAGTGCAYTGSASLTGSMFSIGDCTTGPDIMGNVDHLGYYTP